MYKITDPQNYLLRTLDGKILRGIFQHGRLTTTITKTSDENGSNLPQLKQMLHLGTMVSMKHP